MRTSSDGRPMVDEVMKNRWRCSTLIGRFDKRIAAGWSFLRQLPRRRWNLPSPRWPLDGVSVFGLLGLAFRWSAEKTPSDGEWGLAYGFAYLDEVLSVSSRQLAITMMAAGWSYLRQPPRTQSDRVKGLASGFSRMVGVRTACI